MYVVKEAALTRIIIHVIETLNRIINLLQDSFCMHPMIGIWLVKIISFVVYPYKAIPQYAFYVVQRSFHHIS